MKRFLFIIGILAIGVFVLRRPSAQEPPPQWWSVQSIDTMKYSRDPSREKLGDPSYDKVIDDQITKIAATGATHVAIATPYDDEFIPMLRRWVASARSHGLHVWFRGNFSGWEKWFNYPSISRDEYKAKTEAFIRVHADLFADGDIFSPCPECENGGPGDPRRVGDVVGYRAFLKSLYDISTKGFIEIGKKVESGYFSMNGDVARLVMDPETTKALGGKVVIDHYVASPAKLRDDLVDFAKRSGGKIVLGEFGAPIPDIHGKMSEAEQAKWIDEALAAISTVPEVIGVNYWTNTGGSTQLWDESGHERLAVGVLTKYYTPRTAIGVITDELDRPIAHASVSSALRTTITDKTGRYSLPYVGNSVSITVVAPSYKSYNVMLNQDKSSINIQLVLEHESAWFALLKLIRTFLKIF